MDYLIGHLVGDYLLQTDWQAGNKKSPGLIGWLACLSHCLVWTLSVLLFTGWWNLNLAILVFLSHLVLDRTKFIAWYVRIVKKSRDQWLNIICDNALHLVFLWLIAKYAA